MGTDTAIAKSRALCIILFLTVGAGSMSAHTFNTYGALLGLAFTYLFTYTTVRMSLFLWRMATKMPEAYCNDDLYP